MMKKLNLGCGTDIRPGWINVDIQELPGVDLVADLSQPKCLAILADTSVSIIDMPHILEHIANPLPLLEELWRVAEPNAQLTIRVPHGACDMAFADPQHVRQYFPTSFQFFAQPSYKRADYGYKGDWETEEIILRIDPSTDPEMPKEHMFSLINQARNFVWEIEATLRAVKPRRLVSEPWEFAPRLRLQGARP